MIIDESFFFSIFLILCIILGEVLFISVIFCVILVCFFCGRDVKIWAVCCGFKYDIISVIVCGCLFWIKLSICDVLVFLIKLKGFICSDIVSFFMIFLAFFGLSVFFKIFFV